MKPPKKEYERVPTDEFVIGVLDDYEYEAEHEFKGGPQTGPRKGPAIRLKFTIEGMQYPKRSRWMSFSYHEKSNLYLKYLSALVKDARPNMDFDLDALKGTRVKMLWKDDPRNADFQLIDTIRPIGEKIDNQNAPAGDDTPPLEGDEAPF